MVYLLYRGVGILVKSLVGLGCPQATRCSSLPSTVSLVQCVTTRWFSKKLTPEELSRTPSIEDPPKRPLTAFIRFCIQQRPQVAKQHPEARSTELMKLLGTEWRALSEVEKQIYIDATRADILKYRESLQSYKDKLDPLEWETLKDVMRQKRRKKKTRSLKREKTKYGKPKGCRTPFNIFMTETYPEAKGDSITEKFKHVSHKWSELPSSDKQVYMQLAEDDKVRYANEMKVWEDQMIEIGRHDLIRNKSRVKLSPKKSYRKGKAISKEKKSKKVSKTASGKESQRKHEE
ncbi:transcription factor A, mitochondrial-like [Hyperolius riggenbachi]|uniref:transcription factor A, mitochondrial-like n=1 Tax=Hyperolius riggenbachi TaxID=752182 RepID=UPI0035A2D696